MENPLMNLIIDTDSYKATQWLQYPPGMTGMYSYLESRGGEFVATKFFGLQYIIKRYLTTPITVEMVEEAHLFFQGHFQQMKSPFNYDGWMYIAKDLGGKLPVRIRAVPEGLVIPTKNILVSVESTDEKVPWVVGWLETMLMRIWYPITVCTLSYSAKAVIMEYLAKTSENPEVQIKFKLHDFGSRGVSSQESAMLGGAAHLLNFLGSDTLAGIWMMNKYYSSGMSGFSIPASEHSTITSWGREGEFEAYANLIEKFKGQMVACVSDSYDLFHAIDKGWGEELKAKLIEDGTLLVVRPDSGNPTDIVSQCLKLLDQKFGTTVNKLGFKVLNHVRVIQGDGIDLEEIQSILARITTEGYSTENLAFGMGGGLLQKVNRDTMKFAFKCSSVTVDGATRDVFKDPITDPGKKSKTGRLKLVKVDSSYKTIRQEETGDDILEPVYENGILLRDEPLRDILGR